MTMMNDTTAMPQVHKLSDVCEPVFLLVCRLNRAARIGSVVDMAAVRAEVDRVFRVMADHAVQVSLQDQYQKVRPALIFFVDLFIYHSRLPWREQWELLSQEERWAAPGNEFFVMLEETEQDLSPAASERLGIFYTCLALGFTGSYHDKPEELKQIFSRVRARVEGVADVDPKRQLCPEAYQGVFRDVPRVDAMRTFRRALVFTGMGVAAIVILNLALFSMMTRDVLQNIKLFIGH